MAKIKANLRNMVKIVAILTVTTMLAACDNGNPNDDDDGNGGGKQINSPIVGVWVYGVPKASEWAISEWTKTNFLYGTSVGLYEFKANGTYLYRLRTSNNVLDVFFQNQGKFRVEGNKITLFDRTENYMDFDLPRDNYQNKSISDKNLYFQSTKMSNGNDAMFIENTLQDLEKTTKWYWEKVK